MLWYVARGTDPEKFAKGPVRGVIPLSDSHPCRPPQSRPPRSEPPQSTPPWSKPLSSREPL
eukprot:4281638-Alexandrium_andersonii.AAC.1